MKIRTDFVTNSSSSSFVLEIYIDLENGKSLLFKANGGSAETGIIDYFWDEATVTVSPKQLGSAKNVQELIELLKNGVYDGWRSAGNKLFESKSEEAYKRRHNPIYFIDMIQEYVHSMDDISRIVISGNESGMNWTDYYNRTFAYSPKKQEYVCKCEGYEFEKDGSSGGDLFFDDAHEAKDINYIPVEYDVISTKGYAIQKGKERKQKLREAVSSGVVEILLGEVGTASKLSKQYSREISPTPDNVTFKGKNFVHTSCVNEETIDKFILSNGGEVRSSTVLATNYLIVGNNIDHKTSKIHRALELNAKGKSIIAMTESEFWTLATKYKNEEAQAEASSKHEHSKVLTGAETLKVLWDFQKKPDGTLEITGYKGTEAEVTIPERIDNEIVTSIGRECFYANMTGWMNSQKNAMKNLCSVTIPDSITSIGEKAFFGCENLTIFIAPKVPFSLIKKEKLALPATIGFLADNNRFKDEETIIEYKKYASSQKKKILPLVFEIDLVESVSFYAKEGKITVENFESDYLIPAQNAKATQCIAFLLDWKNNNISLEELEKHQEKELLKDPFNATDMKKIWSYKKLEDGSISITGYKGKRLEVEIPPRIGKSPVTAIGYSAFYCCSKLTSITIPDSVTSIDGNAFLDCRSLTSIVIPDTVTSIGDRAFIACSSLTSIVIPDSVTSIGYNTFSGCKSLIIHTSSGSYAETYAKKEKIPVKIV